MFKRDVKSLGDILSQFIRKEGLETPLLQKRVIDSWTEVTGHVVAQYTGEKYIKNQILFVKILPAASMRQWGAVLSVTSGCIDCYQRRPGIDCCYDISPAKGLLISVRMVLGSL